MRMSGIEVRYAVTHAPTLLRNVGAGFN